MVNGWGRGILNWFAPAPEGSRECDREEPVAEEPSSSTRDGSSLAVGEGGKLALGGAWKGRSVGEMYLREVEGPSLDKDSGSSSIGVIGGGGVAGGDGEVNELPRRGEDSTGAEDERPERGLLER